MDCLQKEITQKEITMSFPSYNFGEHDFLELCRFTDKVQKKSKNFPLLSDRIRKCIYIFSLAQSYGSEVWVETWSCFSIEGYQFKRHCTQLVLRSGGGMVRRCEAPERPHGIGKGIRLFILDPTVTGHFLEHLFPGFIEEITGTENELILNGD